MNRKAKLLAEKAKTGSVSLPVFAFHLLVFLLVKIYN